MESWVRRFWILIKSWEQCARARKFGLGHGVLWFYWRGAFRGFIVVVE